MDFGLGVLGYHGCWDDAALAEQHGFATVGFVDSPLLGGETFACLALAAQATSRIRLGTFIAVPSNRTAPTTAQGIATINRLAPGRTFLALGTGYTGRNTFGLPPVPTAVLREYAQECRGLLDGREVVHRDGERERPIRFGQRAGDYIDLEHGIPVYVAADAPKALRVAGEAGDGWVVTLMFANVMLDVVEVFSRSLAEAEEAARAAGRSLDGAEVMWSNTVCVLEPGEQPTDPRVLERVGPYAMMPFHSYADRPAIADLLPPAIQERLSIYREEVLDRLPVAPDRLYQETHRGHLSHLLDGEARVLTDEIVRMTTLTGTAEEIAERLRELESAGLTNLTIWAPPTKTREVVLEVHDRLMPLVERR
jgi:alkanesulfonate monooxygenase SsuD/methylene tetrahydromethanopterin reductase-like flavin-dependent oxidoreductase (luciferase family)